MTDTMSVSKSPRSHNKMERLDSKQNPMYAIKMLSTAQEESEATFNTGMSFYSSHKSVEVAMADEPRQNNVMMNKLREAVASRLVEVHDELNPVEDSDSQKHEVDKDQESDRNGDYASSRDANLTELRIRRKHERELDEIEAKEFVELCGTKLQRQIERILKQMTDGSPYEELEDAYKLMMQSGNTHFYN